MGWMQKLYDTYERCEGLVGVREGNKPPLMPIYHTTQQAQVEAVVDTDGNWRSAGVIEEKGDRTTLIPCTEKSASRTSGPVPHPLFDKLEYIAGDYGNYRDPKDSHFEEYIEQLEGWCNSEFSHPKVRAVLEYLRKKTLMEDLIRTDALFFDESEKNLPEVWTGKKEDTPPIFKVCPKDQAGAFVRFKVVQAGGEEDSESRIWEDRDVWQSFIDYQNSLETDRDFCYVLGKKVPVSTLSPKYIRRPGDGAKLISANDEKDFTYRGRFETPSQAFCLGQETTEKAHNALKWLIRRQAYVNRGNPDQVILTWRPDGGKVPDPCENSLDLMFDMEPDAPPVTTGEEFASRFRRALAGYGEELRGGEDACVMGMDSATPGRLSVFYYREMQATDLFRRISSWHRTCTWHLVDFPKKGPVLEKGAKPIPFDGAPSPETIVRAAYGARVDDKLSKSAVQRILPCIVDGAPLPEDLMLCAVRRASNPAALDGGEARFTLGVACALVRKYYNDQESGQTLKDENYKERWKMALDPEEKDRSYLYGRLLAAAEVMESSTYERTENRQTNAERMMNAFSQHPFTTWPLLYKQILPYEGKMTAPLRGYYKKIIGTIFDTIEKTDYENDAPLDGRFLLGYFCQRQSLLTKKETPSDEAGTEENNN